MKLYIGNKNYSSWSMRPWLALKATGLPFDEEIIWLDEPDTEARIAAISPNKRVPVLVDGELVVPESIAILEYLAEAAPQLWPQSRKERAEARAVSAEMHAGFAALRKRCPMNIRRVPSKIDLDADVQADVRRLITLFETCRAKYEDQGPFLFGPFTNADAMFAPVISRFHAYAIAVTAPVQAYMKAMMETPMWQAWEKAARAETRHIAKSDNVR